MMKNLRSYLVIFKALPHMIVICARQATGRWHYFRDRPDWFVGAVASMHLDGKQTDTVVAIVKEARAERMVRFNQMLRRLQMLHIALSQSKEKAPEA